jgi:hypothetical protein
MRGCWSDAAGAAALREGERPVLPGFSTLPILAFEALEPRETDWTVRQTLFGETET